MRPDQRPSQAASTRIRSPSLTSAWPPSRKGTGDAAAAAPVPFLLGGHALVSDGLRILVDAAWLGR